MSGLIERTRETGTIAVWSGNGTGRIRTDDGDCLRFHYWSVLSGFALLRAGQRVEFSRGAGLRRTQAELVLALADENQVGVSKKT